jgi:hypothetical protein
MRRQVSNLADDARSFVARIWLVLEPADAAVFVDGERAKLRDQNVLLVDPGEHELRIEAEGFQPEVRPIRAEAGQSSELKLALLEAVKDSQPASQVALTSDYEEPEPHGGRHSARSRSGSVPPASSRSVSARPRGCSRCLPRATPIATATAMCATRRAPISATRP